MAIGSIDATCIGFVRSQRKLSQQYQSLKISLPSLSSTPELRKSSHFPTLNRISKRSISPLPLASKSVQVLPIPLTSDILKITVVEKPKCGYKTSDPRFLSPYASWKGKGVVKRHRYMLQRSLIVEDEPKTCLYDADKPEWMHFAKNRRKDRTRYRLLVPIKTRKMVSNQACETEGNTQIESDKGRKTLYRSISPLYYLTEQLKLADDDDEDKCVLGDHRDALIHL